MPVGVGSTQVTGIDSVSNASDAVNKQYVDISASGPSITNQDNNFLTTNGNTSSWQPVGSYQEYIAAGTYTFNVPSQAKQLFIEATGAGGSGASGTRDASSYVNTGAGQWFLRTSGHTSTISGFFGGPGMIYANNVFYAGTEGGAVLASTDAITWITRTTGFGATAIISLVYSGNLYVACGQVGKLITSTNTINWTMQTTGAGVPRLNALGYNNNNGIYVLGMDNDARIFASTNAIVWQLRTSGYPTGNAIYGFVYEGGQYVLSGGSGRFQTSTDGITWFIRTGVNNNSYTNVSYGNGLYFATGASADIIVSTDAITWVARTGVNYTQPLYATTFGNNTYYAVGGTGFIFFSTDTVTWSFRTSPGAFGSGWRGVVYGNNTFAVGGDFGYIGAALPPTGFAGSGGGGGATASWNISKAYISGTTLTVKVGKGGVYGSSGDSSVVSWTGPGGNFSVTANGGSAGTNVYNSSTQSIPGGAGGTITASSNYLQASAGTAGGNGGIFEALQVPSNATTATSSFQTTGGGGGAVSNSNTNSSNFYGSYGSLGGTINYYGNTVSSTLDQRNMNGTSATNITGLSYGYGGNGGSSNALGGSFWRLRTANTGGNGLYTTYYDGSNYIYGGDGGRLGFSTDSIVWVLRTSSYGASATFGVVYGNGVYVIDGNSGLRSSTDSINWTFRSSGTANQIGTTFSGPSLLYQDGFFYGAGASGALIASTDAIVWQLRTAGTTGQIYSIIYDNGQYILGAASRVINVSTNGIVWIARTLGIGGTGDVSSLAYGNGRFIASNRSGSSVSTSTDTITWIVRTLITEPYASIYGGGTYIAAGNFNYVHASIDSFTWHLRTGGWVNGGSVSGGCFGNNIFLLVSSGSDMIATTATKAGSGGNGVRGGGGGGGAYDGASTVPGFGGNGGDGYVRISWQ